MPKTSILVVGYGNSIRGDDGLGPAVATQVEAWNLQGVKTLSLHQLTPEVAAELAIVKYAIFIDASIDKKSIEVIPIQPLENTEIKWGHYLSPQTLLNLTQNLYETVPQADLISIPGVNFELCDRLSLEAENSVTKALEIIDQLMSKFSAHTETH